MGEVFWGEKFYFNTAFKVIIIPNLEDEQSIQTYCCSLSCGKSVAGFKAIYSTKLPSLPKVFGSLSTSHNILFTT